MTEAGMLGAIATLLGLVSGLLLAMVLTWVVNPAFFGWTITLRLPWSSLLAMPLVDHPRRPARRLASRLARQPDRHRHRRPRRMRDAHRERTQASFRSRLARVFAALCLRADWRLALPGLAV